MTIPVKREQKPTSTTGAQIAPGSYNHEAGEKATRPKSISAVIPKV